MVAPERDRMGAFYRSAVSKGRDLFSSDSVSTLPDDTLDVVLVFIHP
jgi:hypothetical protein